MADPAPLSFKTGGGGGGLGGVAYKDRARPPPRGLNTVFLQISRGREWKRRASSFYTDGNTSPRVQPRHPSLHTPLPQTLRLRAAIAAKDCGGSPRSTPLCDIPSGCRSFTGPWTVTRSSLRMLRRVAAFCRPLRLVLLLVLFPRSRSPVVGVLGL